MCAVVENTKFIRFCLILWNHFRSKLFKFFNYSTKGGFMHENTYRKPLIILIKSSEIRPLILLDFSITIQRRTLRKIYQVSSKNNYENYFVKVFQIYQVILFKNMLLLMLLIGSKKQIKLYHEMELAHTQKYRFFSEAPSKKHPENCQLILYGIKVVEPTPKCRPKASPCKTTTTERLSNVYFDIL